MAATYPTPPFAAPGVSLPADDVYVLPASVAQQRFWLLDQLQPGNSALNMPLALSLRGELDVNALHDALNEVVARHEILRTTFTVDEGCPAQVVLPQLSLSLEKLGISDLPEEDREAETQRLLVEEAHTGFDLSRGPLFRTKLITVGPEEHILLLTLHHIICDGWSNGILVREINELYDAFSQGLASPLPDLPIQYADFAIWQNEWLKSERFEEQFAYWKDRLGSQLPALELPTDFPRNRNRTSFGTIDSLLLPRPLTRAIKAMSQRADVTPFMIYLAAFKVLLHRYTGQADILVGSPTANRSQSETELLIGAFANTLMLKTNLSGDPTFNELLERVREVCLGAFTNQAVPFEKLAEEIRPAQSRGGGALFQVLFVFQQAFMQPVELPKLTIAPIRSVSPGSIFELSLGVVERGEGTRLQLEYNTDLFKPETIKRMLADLQKVLQAAMLDHRRTVSQLLPWTTPIGSRASENNEPLVNTKSVEKSLRATQPAGDLKIEELLKEIWRDVLHVSSVGVKDDFFEIGGHSLLAARLFDDINKKIGVNLPIATLLKATTIEQLAIVIKQQGPQELWEALVPINTLGTKPPLFLVHAAGGNVLFYKDLADRLGPDQPCYGLQARGLDGKQLVHASIDEMAAHYIDEMKRVQPEGPYYVGGSSFGGLIAYEIGYQLRERGEEVERIALFDTYAPGYPKLLPGTSRLTIHLFQLLDRLQHHIDTLRILNKGQRWSYLRSKTTKARNVLRRDVREFKKRMRRNMLQSLGRQLPEALQKTQNAIVVASRSYKPRPYDGPVTLFRATKQQRGIVEDKALGWSEFVTGHLDIHEIPGSHGSIVVEPRVRLLVDMLQPYLGDSKIKETLSLLCVVAAGF